MAFWREIEESATEFAARALDLFDAGTKVRDEIGLHYLVATSGALPPLNPSRWADALNSGIIFGVTRRPCEVRIAVVLG